MQVLAVHNPTQSQGCNVKAGTDIQSQHTFKRPSGSAMQILWAAAKSLDGFLIITSRAYCILWALWSHGCGELKLKPKLWPMPIRSCPHCPLRAQQGRGECNTVAGTADRSCCNEAPRRESILTGICSFLDLQSAPLGAIYCHPGLSGYLPLSSEKMRNQRERTPEMPAMWQARLVGHPVVGYA